MYINVNYNLFEKYPPLCIGKSHIINPYALDFRLNSPLFSLLSGLFVISSRKKTVFSFLYRAKLYIYKDNSIKNSRFTQDTKFYVNGNEAKIESVSDTMAVVYYDFDAIEYSTIPFDMENTDTSIGGTLMLDWSVIENMIMEDDSLKESYFDDDYYFVWYNKYGDVIAKINGSVSSSLKVDASMAETTVYAELKIAGKTISSKKIEIPTIVIKGDVDQNKTVNDIDAEYLLKYLCGSITLNEAQLKAALVNDDKNVNMLDVIAILNN